MKYATLIRRTTRILSSLGVMASFAIVSAAMTLAAPRMHEQDEAGLMTELAQDFLRFEAQYTDADATGLIQLAEFDEATGARLGGALVDRSMDLSNGLDLADLDTARLAGRERQCLAEAIYYEARSESLAGQMAVAEVVLNRMRHRAYPNSICGVVYQGSERRTGCQFTFTCDGSIAIAPRGRSWDRSQRVADHALMGFARPVTNRATHYHTTAVDPIWNDSLVRTRRIGTHIFYRFPNRSERRLLAEREA